MNNEKAIVSLKKRFWKHVDKTTSCWNWTGCKVQGYGLMSFNGKPRKCSHLVHILLEIEIPDGLFVLHKCDNRACVNPDHLYFGTQRENVRDMMERGRQNCWNWSKKAKLSDSSVSEIKRLRKDGATVVVIAKRFRINESTVSKIIHGKRWKHVLASLLFCFSVCRAEVISLGTLNSATGIDIVYPDRSDIVSCELTFLKPGNGTSNLVTMATTNRLLQLADIPAEVPEGRVIVAMRWLCLGGVKSGYRLATMDLYRTPPDAPVAKPTFVSSQSAEDNPDSGPAHSESLTGNKPVVGNGTIAPMVYTRPVKPGNLGTNDAPVRAWHGALTTPTVKQSLSVDHELAQAIAEHFRKPTDLPPLPTSTGGMQRAYFERPRPVQEIKQEARDAMLQFYRNGGQKGRK